MTVSPGLFSNFVEYFNDNVCMMAMAATIGSFAAGLAGRALGEGCGQVAQAQMQMAICLVVICLLRLWGLSLRRASPEGSIKHDVYSTMLQGLPWFLRVPMVTVLPAYLEALYGMVGWNPADLNNGAACAAFALNMLVFVFMFAGLLGLGCAMRSFTDANKPDAKWSTFFVQAFYLAFLSGSGKTMHYATRVVCMTLNGPIDPVNGLGRNQVLGFLICILVATAIAFILLASALPNQMSNQLLDTLPFTQIHLTCQQYVVVYTWAYLSVAYGWDVIYVYMGGRLTSYGFGFFVFCCWLLVCLATACVFAATTPDNSFYDMGKENSKRAAACMMNYWLVDFITWWAQSQVMTSLDIGIENLGEGDNMTQSSWPVIGANFSVIMGGLFLIGGMHACNHEALLFKMAKNVNTKWKVFHHIAKGKSRDFDYTFVDGKDDDDDGDEEDEDEDEDSDTEGPGCCREARA